MNHEAALAAPLELLDDAPFAFLSFWPDGEVLTANSTLLRWLSLARDEVEGKLRVHDLLAETSQTTFADALLRIHDDGRLEGIDLILRRRDGSHFPVLLSAATVAQEPVRFAWARACFADVTGRDHATGHMHRLLDAAPDATIVVNAAGRIEFVNREAERSFGYARVELVGQFVEVLVPERLRAAHAKHRSDFTRALRTRPMGVGLDLLGVRKDGSSFPIEISLSHLVLEDGVHVIAAIRDISERVAARHAVQLAADRLGDAIESIEEAFAVVDAQGLLTLHNQAFRALHEDVLAGPLVGRSIAELARDVAVAEGLDAAQQEAAGQQRMEMLALPSTVGRVDRRGRVYRVVTRRTREGGAVIMMSDRSDELQREEALSKASAAKTDFLSSVSHELRTPLNAVLGFAQLLRRDRKTPLTERQSGMIDHVLAGGEHLLRLIDDILDLTRIEAGRIPMSIEPIDVAVTVAQAVATLAPMAARAEIELVVDGSIAAVGPVMADRTRLAQILMNYGSNAIKYGRKGGRATFSASLQADERVRLSVLDDGLGIAEDQQDRLFQPFYRAGQETGPIEGTGIGLAITRRLVDTMGGSVGFRSRLGEGSEFWVELPSGGAVPRHVPGEGVAGRLSAATGPTRTLVYVEDQPANIAFMRELMADLGRIELWTAPTAEIGIELIRAHRPAVVILDINLPGMSGLEAVRLLKSWPETRDIPVIALSAAAMERDIRRGLEAGFYRYLTKPVQVDELIATLEQLLNGPPGPN